LAQTSADAHRRCLRVHEVRETALRHSDRVDYTYDGLGRRVEKLTYTNDSLSGSVHFVYDGWRVMEELDENYATQKSYTLGLDLSGSLEGAGGIGGLLAIAKPLGTAYTAANYFYDGNGNVIDLAADDGTSLAHYAYAPFGERLAATGTWAEANAYQFSSKPRETINGFYYYGLRYYNPGTGRWLSRDPIEEQGGLNLYGMAGNNAVNQIDFLGLCPCKVNKFKINVEGWTRGWPNFRLWGAKSYTLYLNVEFEIEVEDEKDCKMLQWKKGETGAFGATRDVFSDWTRDGSIIWNTSDWASIPHSGWSGSKGHRKATFQDKPGFHIIPASSFPVYWGGVGGSGPFWFKTEVLDAAKNTTVKEITWGMRIDYTSPASGSHNFYF